MAKLPYTYTICPDQEEPKRFTASCKDGDTAVRFITSYFPQETKK
jgi:hypothetical protein